MSLFDKLFKKDKEQPIKMSTIQEKEYFVPADSFCAVFYRDCCVKILESGKHTVPDDYTVSPPISYNTQTVTIGYPYDLEDKTRIFYKLTVQYKITNPYLYILNADRGEFVSAHVTSLMDVLLWNKNKEEAIKALSEVVMFEGRASEIVFNSVDSYGVKILSASCVLSSLEKIRSVPHDEEIMEIGNENHDYIRGYFYNSTGLTEDDLPI